MHRVLVSLLALLAALALPHAPAQAAWLEAQSTNFVIYADDDEAELRELAQRLERYHSAMELITGVDMLPPSPSNRVTIYVLSNWSEMRRLTGSQMIAGFYSARAGRPAAFVPAQRSGRRSDFNLTVLLHEYAHHFMISNSRFALPAWYGEGGAEFFASARYNADGGMTLGLPAAHRFYELYNARDVPLSWLLDPQARGDDGQRPYDNFYGKSWLLFHMLVFDPEYRGRMGAYLGALTSGQTARQAADGQLGDMGELQQALDDYATRPRMLSMRFAPEQLETGTITVRPMNPGEAEMMPLRVVSVRGVNRDQALELLGAMRAVAARYPWEAAVQDWLSEAEFDAGYDAEAIAAADAALAIDPSRVNAYVQKGYALFRMADAVEEDQPARVAAYRAAAAPYLALNAVENDHPLALYHYYLSFTQSGRTPGPSARSGLEHAVELAPFDWSLRLTLAEMYLSADQIAEARHTLMPIAYAAHGGGLAERARTLIDRIDSGPVTPGAGAELILLLHQAEDAASAGEPASES
ncbi:MAG: hypothetical protein ABIT10_12490 [Alteraurantiacibacter sp.]